MQERARQLGPLGTGQVRHGFPVLARWERGPALLRTDKRADLVGINADLGQGSWFSVESMHDEKPRSVESKPGAERAGQSTRRRARKATAGEWNHSGTTVGQDRQGSN